MDMDHTTLKYGTTPARVASRWPRVRLRKVLKSITPIAISCRDVKDVSVESSQGTDRRVTQSSSTPSDRFENWLQIRRRARDDTEDLARRRLLVERIRQVRVLRLQLFEEADVLDRDHRLVS